MDEAKGSRWELLIAWLATATAVLLAVLPAVAPENYDGTLAVLTVTLIAVVWYTYFTSAGLRHAERSLRYQIDRAERDRGRARQGLATGLLAEVKSLEAQLRQVAADRRKVVFNPLASPILAEAFGRLELFRPETVDALMEFAQSIHLTGRFIDEALSRPPDEVDRPLAHAMGHANMAVRQIPRLVDCLEEEGGTSPKPRASDVIALGIQPELPESPFGPFDVDRGWLDEESAKEP